MALDFRKIMEHLDSPLVLGLAYFHTKPYMMGYDETNGNGITWMILMDDLLANLMDSWYNGI